MTMQHIQNKYRIKLDDNFNTIAFESGLIIYPEFNIKHPQPQWKISKNIKVYSFILMTVLCFINIILINYYIDLLTASNSYLNVGAFGISEEYCLKNNISPTPGKSNGSHFIGVVLSTLIILICIYATNDDLYKSIDSMKYAIEYMKSASSSSYNYYVEKLYIDGQYYYIPREKKNYHGTGLSDYIIIFTMINILMAIWTNIILSELHIAS